MGPELQIVVLDMSLEEQMGRMRKRHMGNEAAVEFAKVNEAEGHSQIKRVYLRAVYDASEPAEEKEANTIDLNVQTFV